MKNIIVIGILFLTLLSCTKDSVDPIVITDPNPNSILLKTDVIDAEYSKSKEILVYISSNPSSLTVFNTNSDQSESIPLDYTPTCVSISQDGETAVVGHNGRITYVNLTTKTALKSYAISCIALDIVLGNNKWAYVFPKDGQWTYIRSINMNLSYDNESSRTIYNQVHEGTLGRLHPSGTSIYSANDLSPSTIKKVYLTNGEITNSYESTFQGGYSSHPNIWFSEDGIRVLSEKKIVLKTSDINSLDMTLNGKIDPNANSFIKWLDFSTIKNSIYSIAFLRDYSTQKIIPYISIYNASNLVYKNKIDLEKIFLADTKGGWISFSTEPHFVFSNSSGDHLYIISKAVITDEINQWAIQKTTIN